MEIYSDRRRNERRNDSRGSTPRRGVSRRRDARLNRSFNVSVLDYDGKTVNISARGAYLEVSTNDMREFPMGASHPLFINLVSIPNMIKSREIKHRLSGRGTVVRNCIIQNLNQTDSLGVALKFTEKLQYTLEHD